VLLLKNAAPELVLKTIAFLFSTSMIVNHSKNYFCEKTCHGEGAIENLGTTIFPKMQIPDYEFDNRRELYLKAA
jgi:hypothetical protein